MKPIILRSDGPACVYLVPDKVADNLGKHCVNFAEHWLIYSAHAEKYRDYNSFYGLSLSFSKDDFIEYLNNWLYPDQPSSFIATLDELRDTSDLYYEYLKAPRFDF